MSTRLHVLAVDDHPVNLRYLEITLSSAGHTSTACADGQQAVNAARTQVFDLVLMDLHMPVMDGETAIRAIRALPPPHGQVPIYAVSADTAEATRDRVRKAGANGFLDKPVSPAKLRHAIASLATASGASDAGSNRVADAVPGATATGSASAPIAASPPSPVDGARLAELRTTVPAETLRAMFTELLDAPDGTLAALLQHLDAGRASEAAAAAHRLKGSAMLLGLSQMQRLAEQTERHAATGAPDGAAVVALSALAAVLREAARRTRAALRDAGVAG